MILGSYPCCDGELTLAMPETSPAFAREACPHCQTIVWHKLSRIASKSWVEEDFLKEHDVDDATRQITPKQPSIAIDPVLGAMMARIVGEMVAKEIIGPPSTDKDTTK